MPPRTAAASAPVPSLLDLFSPRLKKKSLEYKCFTMCYYFPLYNKVNQPKKKKTHGDFAIHDCQIIYRMVK